MENYFFLLELPFDPVENDQKKIEKAIAQKQDQWSGDSQNSAKGGKYLPLLNDIREVMLDVKKREAAADEAKKIKKKEEEKLKKQLALCHVIGDTLSEQALAQLLEQFGFFGFTESEIRRLFNSIGGQTKQREQEISPDEVLSRDLAQKVKKYLQQLYPFDEQPHTLYTLLGKSGESSADQLRNTAATMEKRVLDNGNKSVENDLKGELYRLCLDIFKDQASKQKYDNYIKLIGHSGINDAVDLYAKNNQQKLDLKVKERLIDFAIHHYELSVPDASAYIDNYCAYMGYIVTGDKVACGQCGAENPAGSVICAQCGKPLFINCPSCGQRSGANTKVCSCGFKMENIDRVKDLCGLAEQAIKGLNFQSAEVHLTGAERLWPNNSMVPPLRSRLSEYQQRIGTRTAKLREATRARAYIEAQRQYEAIQLIFPRYRDPALEREISAAISGARSLCIQASRSTQKDEVLDLCAQASALCADLQDIRELSAKYPPDPPAGFSVKADPYTRGNVLSWTVCPEKRPVRCVVVRSCEGRVQNLADGKEIFRGNASSYWDKDIEPGVLYWYNVFTERDGIHSQGAEEGCREVLNLFETGPVSVTPGNRSLKLSWETLPGNATVEIYLSGPGGEKHLAATREKSFLITGIDNDVKQRFRVALSYLSRGRQLETPGITISAAPVCPPSQVEALRIRSAREGVYEAVWRHTGQGDARLFASARKPRWRAGTVIQLSALEREMTALQTQPLPPASAEKLGQGERGAFFRDPGGETLYITAAAVKSGSAVFGPLVRAGREAAVTIRDIRTVNGKLHIFLDVPREASGFTVLYCFDRFPAGVSDPEAAAQHFSRQQYEVHNAILLEAPKERTYYFTVFAWFDRDGEREWSPGAERLLDCSRKTVITYSVSAVRGFFGEGSAILKFQADVKRFTLPAIDVLSAVGAAPIFRDKAKLLHTIPSQEVEGSLRVKIPLPKETPKGACIKPFFRDEAAQARNQLRLKLRSNHRIT